MRQEKSHWRHSIRLSDQEYMCVAIAKNYKLISVKVHTNGCNYIFDKCELGVEFIGCETQPPQVSLSICPRHHKEYGIDFTHFHDSTTAGEYDLYADLEEEDDEEREDEKNIHPGRWRGGPLASAVKGDLMQWLDKGIEYEYFGYNCGHDPIEDEIDEEWENRDKDEEED